MKPATSLPVALAETQIPESFAAETALSVDKRRDRKILLTSLLFTSSLVTFALTSLPQLISLPACEAGQRFAAPLAQPHKNQSDLETLKITVNPAAETVSLSVSSNSVSTAGIQSHAKKVAIALPMPEDKEEGDRYTLHIILQPSALQPNNSTPITLSQVALAQE
jgi:hypothetical protein